MNRKKEKKYRGLVIAICIIMTVLIGSLGGILACFLYQSGQEPSGKRDPQTTESGQAFLETEAFTENSAEKGELFCEGVEEENIAFDQESGMQYADNQLLITAAEGVTRGEIEQIVEPYQAEIVGMIEVTQVYQLKFPQSYSKEELDRIGEELCAQEEVESYEVNAVIDINTSAVYPNDKKWKKEWGDPTPSGINWGMEAIHAPEAWGFYDQMEEVNIGVFDNMFYDHTDLTFQEILYNQQGKDLNDSHGTHVSGIIGAIYNNKKGVCGVFPKARLYGISYKKLSNEGYNGIMQLKVGFTYLIDWRKCKVINLSIGWDEMTFAASRKNEAAQEAIGILAKSMGEYLKCLLELDEENDFVICKSAGNTNSDYEFVRADEGDEDAPYGYIRYIDENREKYQKYLSEKDFKDRIVSARDTGYVQAYDLLSGISKKEIKDRILVVGAAENLGNGHYKVADFSNCGKRVDVLAPGVDIYSTAKKKNYEEMGGTSMAAPHVAGVAAMCFSVNEKLNGAQVADIVRKTAVGSISYEIENGAKQFGSYPMVDAERAVEKALETDAEEKSKKEETLTRDIVLVLDRSGSMDGEPLDQTKEAAVKFVDTVFEREARVSVVAYDTWASEVSPLSDDQQMLEEDIRELYADGTTNMYDGLVQADNILQDSQANRKIIVLMSDGLSNEGENDFGDFHSPLLQYAEELKNKGYYVYTLGFFTDLDSYDLYGAQQLLEGIASPGLHYEVNDPNDLVFFFDDIANQISGTRFVYIRIACPVDVTVSSDGETLSSKAESENGRTSFGTLTYETVQDESQDQGGDIFGGSLYGELGGSLYGEEEPTVQDQAKILRLNMDQDYDVEIEGYDKGTMDYSVSFPNENGEYDDVREFPGIDVTASMKATSNTGESKATYLKVDENGDGKIDTTYKTEANGTMEEVKDSKVLYIVLIAAGILILVLILVIVLVCVSRSKKKKRQDVQPAGYIFGAFGLYQNKMYPMSPGQQCVVGRKTSCDIQLVHSQVSRMHCVIEMLPDGVYQVTNYSSNGTFYNDQKLKYGEPYRLPKGALLAIGDADNVLELR
ncbi:S8 family serine peptidase [Blautia sp.]|uniref:S8 family serine peptidase n=1 Tax=Blautia sp. TaxID=1955243 RepID=UPI0025B9B37E|nr:S8 family serine peptidase [Blautia sp.]